MSESGEKHWLKYGLFGCLGCVGLVVVVVGLTVGLAWMRAGSEKVQDRVLSHAPPAAPETTTAIVPAKARGTVVLELSDGEFHFEPGVAGDPIRVEATYDSNSFSFDEHSEEGADGTWTYRVEFHRSSRSPWWMNMIQQAFSSTKPKVRIVVPPDTPIALEVNVEKGGMQTELGGLHLISAAFHVSMGGMQLSVSEPLVEPIERFAVEMEMGGGELRSIGNASPRVLDVKYRMGGMELDLRGAWSNDAEISLRGSMGGAEVRLPPDVRVEGVPGRKFEGPDASETRVPTLRFTSSSQMGDVKFEQ